MSEVDKGTAQLTTSLAQVAFDLRTCLDRWWIIGSAAMALHGAKVNVADIDVLTSVRDARRLLDEWGVEPAAEPGGAKFRSVVFARHERHQLPVELMAGFHVRVDGRWRREHPRTRIARTLGEATIYVPSVGELAGMCRRFGRSKDTERLRLLLDLKR